jgi:prepilin-type processing-associated H-X9-DG protein
MKPESAFSRIDLLFVIMGSVGILLFVCIGVVRGGERLRTVQCARNLARLGEGMQAYAGAHAQSLPPAIVWTPPMKSAWDTCLLSVLDSTSSKRDTRPALFVCPSDRLTRDAPRSYAMAQHDMKPENWPPGPDNATGLGLVWIPGTVAKYFPDNKAEGGPTLDEFSMMKLTMISAPRDTLLLSELIRADNKFRSTAQAGIDGAAKQIECFKTDRKAFHGGRLNYLMVDGHVELLSALESGGLGGSRGIWTISGGD